MQRVLHRFVSAVLLICLVLAGCNNDDLSSGSSSGDVASGAIGFNTTENALTKGLMESDWETVEVPLSENTPGKSVNTSLKSSFSETASTAVASSASAYPSASALQTRGAPVFGTEAPAGSFGVLGYLLTGGTWNSTTATPSFMYNTQVTRTGSSGSYSYSYYPVKYWPNDTSDKVRFFAYYPYQGNGISLSSATTTGYPVITYTPGTTVSNQIDLMYAACSAVNNKSTETAVSLSFNHALTCINFSAKLDSFFSTEKVVIRSIQMTGIKSSGTLSLDSSLSNPWTIGFTTTSYTASISDGSVVPAANQSLSSAGYISVSTYNGYLLLLPQSVTTSNTVVVSYTVNGLEKTVTYLLPSATWSKGQSINYRLTIPFEEIANCYILSPGSKRIIPVGIKGNGDATTASLAGISTTHTAASVGVLWETTSGLVTCTGFNATSQTVTVNAPLMNQSGNAVIAAYSGDSQSGTILWSWHIWVTSYNPNTKINGTTYSYTNTSGVTNVFMDRNLGATSVVAADVNTYGLLYQWGRKDPFTGSGTYNGNTAQTVYGTKTVTTSAGPISIAEAINAPNVFYYNSTTPYNWCSTQYDGLWSGTVSTSAKSIFDPSPFGWRVPSWKKTGTSASPWIGLASYQGSSYWSTNGYNWVTTPGIGFWPAAGYRNYSSGARLRWQQRRLLVCVA